MLSKVSVALTTYSSSVKLSTVGRAPTGGTDRTGAETAVGVMGAALGGGSIAAGRGPGLAPSAVPAADGGAGGLITGAGATVPSIGRGGGREAGSLPCGCSAGAEAGATATASAGAGTVG